MRPSNPAKPQRLACIEVEVTMTTSGKPEHEHVKVWQHQYDLLRTRAESYWKPQAKKVT